VDFLVVFEGIKSLIGKINLDSFVGGIAFFVLYSKDMTAKILVRGNINGFVVKDGDFGRGVIIFFDFLGIDVVLAGE